VPGECLPVTPGSSSAVSRAIPARMSSPAAPEDFEFLTLGGVGAIPAPRVAVAEVDPASQILTVSQGQKRCNPADLTKARYDSSHDYQDPGLILLFMIFTTPSTPVLHAKFAANHTLDSGQFSVASQSHALRVW